MEGYNSNVFDPKVPIALDFYGFPNKRRWKTDFDLFPNGLADSKTYRPILGVDLTLGYMEHPMALDYRNRFIADGGQLRDFEYFGINYRCWAYEILGLKDIELSYHPFLPGATSNAQKLLNIRHNVISSSFKITNQSVTSDLITDNGFQGNGTSSYLDLNLNVRTHLNNNNHNISIYCRTNAPDSVPAKSDIFIVENATTVLAMILKRTNTMFLVSTNNSQLVSISNVRTDGWHSINRTLVNSLIMNRNAVNIGSSTVSNTGTMPNYNLWLGARNNLAVPLEFSDRQYAAISTSKRGYSQSEEAIRFVIEQNVQTFLNRAIPV